MARVFTDGAEFQDVLAWTGQSSASVSTASYRSGAACYRLGYYGSMYKDIPADDEIFIRFGVMLDTNPSYTLIKVGKATTVLDSLALDINNSRKLYAYSGEMASFLKAGTMSLSLNVWHLIEIRIKIADNPDGIFQVYLDGVIDIDYSGDTKPGADTTIDRVTFMGVYSSNNTFIDDIAINDTSGVSDNSWCGDGHIELLTPVTGGTYQWTGSDGDSVDNYALVDDIPATGDDYVKDSTAGHQDIYSLSDFTGTGKIVSRVWPECRAKDNDNSGGQVKLGMKSGGTTHLGSATALPGIYACIKGDEETLNPDDSGAWEDADLDALQFVVECE